MLSLHFKQMMVDFPNCKINLGLNIVEKRPDGYHNIESVFYPVGLTDILEIIENTSSQEKDVLFSYSGIEIPGNPIENLCYKAYYLLKEKHSLPKIKAHLHKIIPIGAGLGGGSADGAFFINLLDKQFKLKLTIEEKEELAGKLGSDCVFFIKNEPAFVSGRGETLRSFSINLSNYYLVLLNPQIHISTKEAYDGVVPQKSNQDIFEIITQLEPLQWNGLLKNDFEDGIFKKYPLIKRMKEGLYQSGADYASMTGSGSSIYAIFREEPDLSDELKKYLIYKGAL
jgi:4-diphosphocytidyl-2-C-methyl-D-erythritol kinase